MGERGVGGLTKIVDFETRPAREQLSCCCRSHRCQVYWAREKAARGEERVGDVVLLARRMLISAPHPHRT